MNACPTKTIVAVLLGAFQILLAADGSRQTPLKAGDPFPSLEQFHLEGSLPEMRGAKVVLVDFWASWCEPCKLSFATLNKLQKKFGANGLLIIAVNVDQKPANMTRFIEKHRPDFAVVRDAAQKLVESLAIETLPTSLLIDQDGRVRHVHRGFREDETPKQYEREIASLLGLRENSP